MSNTSLATALPAAALGSITAMMAFAVQADPMTISGTPPPTVAVGAPYRFEPEVQHAIRDELQFYYINKPDWSKSYRGSGLLRGIPTAPGVYDGIQIGASDGEHYALMPPFSITVTPAPADATSTRGAAYLTWLPPAFNTDGSRLTDLAGFKICYGTDPSLLDREILVGAASATQLQIEDLAAGPWYFAIAAVTGSSVTSDLSSIARAAIE